MSLCVHGRKLGTKAEPLGCPFCQGGVARSPFPEGSRASLENEMPKRPTVMVGTHGEMSQVTTKAQVDEIFGAEKDSCVAKIAKMLIRSQEVIRLAASPAAKSEPPPRVCCICDSPAAFFCDNNGHDYCSSHATYESDAFASPGCHPIASPGEDALAEWHAIDADERCRLATPSDEPRVRRTQTEDETWDGALKLLAERGYDVPALLERAAKNVAPDPVLDAFLSAPPDDVPESAEEKAGAEEARREFDAAKLADLSIAHGLYIIHWREGGTSLAAVGFDADGKKWFAPTNWLTVPSYDWARVLRLEAVLLERDHREGLGE